MRGLCKYESLLDGTLSLIDIAVMNDLIDVDEENRIRVQRWIKENGGS